MSRMFARLKRDCKAASVMEFGLVAPVLVMLLIGFLDLGHTAYVRAVLQGAIQKAARDGTLQTGGAQANAIDLAVERQVKPVAGKNATFAKERKSYYQFSQVGKGEEYKDLNGNGAFDSATECYEDWNGNGSWDASAGTTGQGGASDVVLYTVTVTYPRLFPAPKMFGWSQNNVASATTVLRNQPYGDQDNPSVTRCP